MRGGESLSYRSKHRGRMPQMRVPSRHYPTKCRLTRIAYEVTITRAATCSPSRRAENGPGRVTGRDATRICPLAVLPGRLCSLSFHRGC